MDFRHEKLIFFIQIFFSYKVSSYYIGKQHRRWAYLTYHKNRTGKRPRTLQIHPNSPSSDVFSREASYDDEHMKPLAKKHHYLANLKGSWTFARAVLTVSQISSTPVLFSDVVWSYLARKKNLDEKYYFFMTKIHFQNLRSKNFGKFPGQKIENLKFSFFKLTFRRKKSRKKSVEK